LEEAVKIWIAQSDVKNGTATDEVIKEKGQMIRVYRYAPNSLLVIHSVVCLATGP
jgi:hypothetical protein